MGKQIKTKLEKQVAEEEQKLLKERESSLQVNKIKTDLEEQLNKIVQEKKQLAEA